VQNLASAVARAAADIFACSASSVSNAIARSACGRYVADSFEEPVHSMRDQFRNSSGIRGDRRHTASHSFQRC